MIRSAKTLIVAAVATALTALGGTAQAAPPGWQPCPAGDVPLECTRVTVPVDWSEPAGDTITLKVSRLRATGTRLGAVVVNPGGPGIPGTQFLAAAGARFAALRASYDVVAWDPRGVGGSAPISCPGPRPDSGVPATVVERERFERETAAWARRCRAAVGPLFDHVDTVSTARDLDRLRQVLDEPRLNYYGGSYGTRIGQFYADLFPQRVGRLTLDAVVDTTSTNGPFVDGATRAKEEAFTDYLDTCASRPGCPLKGMTPARVRSWLIPRITAEPAVGGEIVGYLTSPADWPAIDEHLTRVRAGTYHPPADDEAGDVLNTDVNCLDLPDHRTAAQVIADSRRAAARYPLFGRLMTATTVCNVWPTPATYHPHRITSPTPILLVGTTHDTATPYDWAVRTAGNLGTGRLLTRDGTGHGAYGTGPCVTGAVNRFFVTGALPAPGTVCPG
ncbi:alpha/beta hydrolase [Cryptosporangium arvum]|uniref:Alpha/beta hydrolase family protein n=1 Tax=Cryptosporangium arvum DSM 44712 TaxID=927661 RepID=A0A010ZV81_9ACTN|nr:alpha/beta hydrolase [Cryptosporangium arvum]EXG82604.1 alpha/beta hydrolase family protein [Cryptosporangium arvum DSM 44712]